MSNVVSVPRGCGYYVTESGREAYASEESCKCTWVFQGRLVVCEHCGTVHSIWHPNGRGRPEDFEQ
jgi:hypothetical protein